MNEFKTMIFKLWQDLPGHRRISLIGSFFLVIVVVSAVVYFAGKPNMSLLFGGLEPSEAARIVEQLESKKIPYETAQGGKAVLAPANRIYELRLQLAAQGIPRTSDVAGGVGFELFDKPSFGMSDFMQRTNYLRALQGELARTIRQFDEISDARVIMVAPNDRLFGNERRESKASVFVRLKPGRSLAAQQVEAIRFLVANAVEGLQSSRVAVVDNNGRALAEDQQAGDPGFQTQGQFGAVARMEQTLTDKAQSMLDQVLGPGQSVVRVTADLDFDSVQETSERYDPKGAVVRSETTSVESTTSASESSTGRAGITSNSGDEAPKEAAGSPQSNTQKRENTANQYEITKVTETRQKATGVIRRVSAAIFVNLRKGGGTEGSPAANPRTPQDLKVVEDVVKEAIGFTQNATRQDSIKIQEIEFADWASASKPEAAPSTTLGTMNSWLPYATQGFLIVLAISVFLYLRSIIRQSAPSSEGANALFEDLLHQYDARNGRNGHAGSNGNGGLLSMDELSKVIRENSTHTAHAIKQWMSRN